jgi:hypothetical protein
MATAMLRAASEPLTAALDLEAGARTALAQGLAGATAVLEAGEAVLRAAAVSKAVAAATKVAAVTGDITAACAPLAEALGEYNDLASRLTESLVAADAAAAADSEDGRAGHMAIAQRAVAKLVAAVDGAKPAADTLFAAVGLFEVAAAKHSLTLKSAADATEADTPAARSILEDASTAAVVRLDAMRTHADTVSAPLVSALLHARSSGARIDAELAAAAALLEADTPDARGTLTAAVLRLTLNVDAIRTSAEAAAEPLSRSLHLARGLAAQFQAFDVEVQTLQAGDTVEARAARKAAAELAAGLVQSATHHAESDGKPLADALAASRAVSEGLAAAVVEARALLAVGPADARIAAVESLRELTGGVAQAAEPLALGLADTRRTSAGLVAAVDEAHALLSADSAAARSTSAARAREATALVIKVREAVSLAMEPLAASIAHANEAIARIASTLAVAVGLPAQSATLAAAARTGVQALGGADPHSMLVEGGGAGGGSIAGGGVIGGVGDVDGGGAGGGMGGGIGGGMGGGMGGSGVVRSTDAAAGAVLAAAFAQLPVDHSFFASVARALDAWNVRLATAEALLAAAEADAAK